MSNHKFIEYGLMIENTDGPKEGEKLRTKLRGTLTEGTLYSKLENLIEDPFFTDSKWRNLSQLVDYTAYCVRRICKSIQSNAEKQVWDNYFSHISNKLDKSASGNFDRYGIKL